MDWMDLADKKWADDVALLEEKYADRGLLFTSPFEGFAPIQAFGHLDGKRFYFRLRGGDASLQVGDYDLAEEIAKHHARNRRFGYPENSKEVFKVPKETDKDLYPTIMRFESYTPSNKMKMVELFSLLVETLEPVETASHIES